MLAITTTSAVVAIVAQCVSTVKAIHDVLQEYKDVPQVLNGIREEASAIGGFSNSIVLSLEHSPEALQAAGLTAEFDIAIESCRNTITRVDTYLTTLTDVNWRRRVNVIWNEKELGALRDDLRSKQISLAMLVQALNMYTMSQLSSQISRIHSQPTPSGNRDYHWEYYASTRPSATAFAKHLAQSFISSDCVSTESGAGLDQGDQDPLLSLLHSKDVLKLVSHLHTAQTHSSPHRNSAGRLKACSDAMLEAYDQLISEVKSQTATSYRSTLSQHMLEAKRHGFYWEREGEQTPPPIQYQTKPIRIDHDAKPAIYARGDSICISAKEAISEARSPRVSSKTATPSVLPARPTTIHLTNTNTQFLSSAVEKAARKLVREDMQQQQQQKLLYVTASKAKRPYEERLPMFEPCPEQDIPDKDQRGKKCESLARKFFPTAPRGRPRTRLSSPKLEGLAVSSKESSPFERDG